MSVQLEVLPQNYEGFLAEYYPPGPEVIVDGEIFNNSTFNSNSSGFGVDLSVVSTNSFAAGPVNTIVGAFSQLIYPSPSSVIIPHGTWMSFVNAGSTGATPTFPDYNQSQVFLKGSASGVSLSGIAQRMSGLSIGTEYTITVTLGTIVTSVGAVNNNKLYFGCTNGGGEPMNFANGMSGTPLISTPLNNGAYTPIENITTANQGVTYTRQFTAESEYDIFVLTADLEDGTLIGIDSVSVVYSHGGELSGILGDGSVICDLYEDEDIPLTLSVDNFKNVAEKVQSYSKAFKLPATKRNSRIFDHVFEITRSAQGNLSFNPYIKTQCRLKEDGITLFEGYLRLIDIQDKKGEISFNINLYSEAIALADILKDRDFSALNLSELNHAYTRNTIQASWSGTLSYSNAGTSGFRNGGTVRYPFCDWDHQYIVQSNGNPELVNLEGSFRPFINVKYLIDRIFNQPNFPFTYTSTFLNTSAFENLFMDFNWGDTQTPEIFTNTGGLAISPNYFDLTSSYQTVNFNELSDFPTYQGPQTTLDSNFGYGGSTGASAGMFTAVADNQWYSIDYDMLFYVTSGIGVSTFTCKWVHETVAGVQTNYNTTGVLSTSGTATDPYDNSYHLTGTFNVIMNTGDTLEFKTIKNSGNNMRIKGSPQPGSVVFGGVYAGNHVTCITSVNNTVSASLLQTLRGELNQWDFLKGFITMFNLITIPDKTDPSNILIEPYKDVFIQNTSGTSLSSRSISHDWTEKISVEEMKLTPLTDLNKNTIFKFVEDDDDYSFNVYKQSTGGSLFGSKKYDASGFTILEGEEEIIAEPFAATFCKPLMSQFPDLIVPSIYSHDSSDGTSSSFDNSPRILYMNGVVDLPFSYKIPAQNTVVAADVTQYLQFSHLSSVPTVVSNPPQAGDTEDFHFGEHQLIGGIGLSPILNLFNTYWLPYFGELYNADTRAMVIKVNLSAADISTFNMYDTVFIKNRQFRVNKIDYKPNDLSTVEFILIP